MADLVANFATTGRQVGGSSVVESENACRGGGPTLSTVWRPARDASAAVITARGTRAVAPALLDGPDDSITRAPSARTPLHKPLPPYLNSWLLQSTSRLKSRRLATMRTRSRSRSRRAGWNRSTPMSSWLPCRRSWVTVRTSRTALRIIPRALTDQARCTTGAARPARDLHAAQLCEARAAEREEQARLLQSRIDALKEQSQLLPL